MSELTTAKRASMTAIPPEKLAACHKSFNRFKKSFIDADDLFDADDHHAPEQVDDVFEFYYNKSNSKKG